MESRHPRPIARRLPLGGALVLLLLAAACSMYRPPPPRGPQVDKDGYYFVAKMEEDQYVWTHVGDLHPDRDAAEAEMRAWLRSQGATVKFARVYEWRALERRSIEPGSQPKERPDDPPPARRQSNLEGPSSSCATSSPPTSPVSDESTAQPRRHVKPPIARSVADASVLDDSAISVAIDASGPTLTAILDEVVRRAPRLRQVSILHQSGSTLEARGLEHLQSLKDLESLTLAGDAYLYDDQFAALGHLTRLTSLRLSLP